MVTLKKSFCATVVGGGIYFQSKAAYGLIDWHKLFSFCWRDFNDYRIKSSIEESRFLLEAFPPAFDRRCTLNHLSKSRVIVDLVGVMAWCHVL
jgi:hypothetical protein